MGCRIRAEHFLLNIIASCSLISLTLLALLLGALFVFIYPERSPAVDALAALSIVAFIVALVVSIYAAWSSEVRQLNATGDSLHRLN